MKAAVTLAAECPRVVNACGAAVTGVTFVTLVDIVTGKPVTIVTLITRASKAAHFVVTHCVDIARGNVTFVDIDAFTRC